MDAWRHTVKVGLSQYEETQRLKAEEKRLHKKTVCLASRPTTAFTCSKCDRDCHSRIGLHSHNRHCKMGANLWSLRPTDANDDEYKSSMELKHTTYIEYTNHLTLRIVYLLFCVLKSVYPMSKPGRRLKSFK